MTDRCDAEIAQDLGADPDLAPLPVAVGFGISTPEQVRDVWRFADAAVVGSAIVREIEKLAKSPDLVNRIGHEIANASK